MFNCKSGYIICILLVLLFSSLIDAQEKSGNNITLHLVLDHGFLHLEEVNIKVRYNNGRDSTIYSGKLYRYDWVDDHNFYDIELKKGKIHILIIDCVSRGVSFIQGFLFSKDAYFSLSINPRNEFFGISKDRKDIYD